VLALMFKPGVHQEGFQHSAFFGGILENAPCVAPSRRRS
jgi:hypothetical protein